MKKEIFFRWIMLFRFFWLFLFSVFPVVSFGQVVTAPLPTLPTVPAPSATIDQAEDVSGFFEVNSLGQATYSFPIMVADGTSGMMPSVSVDYSSGRTNGLLGVGWTLSAGGDISRCRQTEGQDKNAYPITWTSHDRFCLNGERLVLLSGQYGYPNSSYRTEIDSYSKVTAVGGVPGQPEYFKVELKNGLIQYYGKNDYGQSISHYKFSSDKIFSWLLTVNEDSAGNKIRYYYQVPYGNTKPLLSYIRYGYGGSNSSHSAEVQFFWETKMDRESGFVGGYAYKQQYLLDSIISRNNNENIRIYRFEYDDGTAYTENDLLLRLNRIYECSYASCKEPIEIEWAMPNQARGFINNAAYLQHSSPRIAHAFGDINGDGVQDIVWIQQGSTEIRYAIGSVSQSGLVNYAQKSFEGNQSVTTSWYIGTAPSVSFIDYNGDGRSDLVVNRVPTSSQENPSGTRVYLSKPQADGSWALSATPVSFLPASVMDLETFFVDLNGDGLQDAIGVNDLKVHYLGAAGSGFGAAKNTTVVPRPGSNCYTNNYKPIHSLKKIVGDFNGDGRVDFIGLTRLCNGSQTTSTYSYYIYTSHKANDGGIELRYFSDIWENYSIAHNVLFTSDSYGQGPDFRVVDLNKDGLSDIIWNGGFRFSNGSSLEAPILNGFSFGANSERSTSIVDINGDGYPDILSATGQNSDLSGSIVVRLWNQNTNKFSSNVSNIPVPFGLAGDSGAFQDIDGDGAPDYVFLGADWGARLNQTHVLINSNNSRVINKVKKIKTALGRSTEIEYALKAKTSQYGYIKGVRSNRIESVCRNTDKGNLCWSREGYFATANDFANYINSPFSEFSGNHQSVQIAPFSPVFNGLLSFALVTSVSKSSPFAHATTPGLVNASAMHKTSYFYDQLRFQAGGRGILGFKRVSSLDHRTGVRRVAEYRQDWPFTGRVAKTEVFSPSSSLLEKEENTWGISDCYSNITSNNSCVSNLNSAGRAYGTAYIGGMKIFKPFSKKYSFYLNTDGSSSLSGINSFTRIIDSYGNPIFEKAHIGDGLTSFYNQVETNYSYIYPTYTYSTGMGRVSGKRVVTSDYSEFGSSNKQNEFSYDYYSSGSSVGLLKNEIIEPSASEYTKNVEYFYNNYGARIYSKYSGGGKERRSAFLEYDSGGRYIKNVYSYFDNTENKRLVSSVISRDRYGNPTNTRRYLNYAASGQSKYVTEINAFTSFGDVYFSADGSGFFLQQDAGTGQGPGSICPAVTKTWKSERKAGGGVSLKCMDVIGRLVREGTEGLHTGEWHFVDYEYQLDRLIHKSEPRFISQNPLWTSSLNIDALGRPERIISPLREQDGVAPESEIRYENNATYYTNSKYQTRIEWRNYLGQVTQISDSANGVTEFFYDASGKVKLMWGPGGHSTTIQYDLLGRRVSVNDPDKGNWRYKYNVFDEVVCEMDGKNQSVSFDYNYSGKLISKVSKTGSSDCALGTIEESVTWRYLISNSFNNPSSSMVNHKDGGIYFEGYSSDSFDRVAGVSMTKKYGSELSEYFYLEKKWDQYGRIFSKVYYDDYDSNYYERGGVNYIYSQTGRLKEIRDAYIKNGQQKKYYIVNFNDGRGNVSSASFGNGVSYSASYYKDSGLAKKISAFSPIGAVALQNIGLEWDVLGNLQSRHEIGGGTWIEQYMRSRNIKESFVYDDLNRLKNWNTSGDFSTFESATYNSSDNILSKTGVGNYLYGAACSHQSNAGPHAVCKVGNVNYFYDKGGNLINDGGGRVFQYTAFNQLSNVSKGSYVGKFKYGAAGNLYERIDSSGGSKTTTTYFGDTEKIEYPDGAIEWKYNIEGVALLNIKLSSFSVEQSRTLHYLHKDHLGSISMITDSNAYVVKDFYYDPWGVSRAPNANISGWSFLSPFTKSTKPLNTLGFTAHNHIDEVGIIHMKGRIYDGKIARFIQADPIVQNPKRSQSLNRYSYVWNNPLNATDPSGFSRAELIREDNGSDTSDRNVRTPDMDLDFSPERGSLFDYDSFLEQQSLRQLFNENFWGSRSINSLSYSTGAYSESGTLLASKTVKYIEPSSALSEGCRRPLPEQYRDIINFSGIDIYENGRKASEISSISLIALVWPGGQWDYKHSRDVIAKLKDAGVYNPVLLAEFGNWHYGYVFAAKGFGLGTVLYGGGGAQVLFQKGGNWGELFWGQALFLQPDFMTEFYTEHGFGWGDNPDDSIPIMNGWKFYHE